MQMLLHDVHVLVAAPREVDDDMPSCGKLAVVPEYPRQCMGGFQRGQDAFGAAEGLEGVYTTKSRNLFSANGTLCGFTQIITCYILVL